MHLEKYLWSNSFIPFIQQARTGHSQHVKYKDKY